MNRTILESQHVGETAKLIFDFISDLALGETLSTSSVAAAVYSGNASAVCTCGATSISGTKVTFTAAGDTEGVVFLVTVTVTTSAGQTLKKSGFLAMTPAGA